jgi:hypothetical protein
VSDLENFCMMLYFDHGIYIWEMYELYSVVTVEISYIYIYIYIYICVYVWLLDFVLDVASIS